VSIAVLDQDVQLSVVGLRVGDKHKRLAEHEGERIHGARAATDDEEDDKCGGDGGGDGGDRGCGWVWVWCKCVARRLLFDCRTFPAFLVSPSASGLASIQLSPSAPTPGLSSAAPAGSRSLRVGGENATLFAYESCRYASVSAHSPSARIVSMRSTAIRSRTLGGT
jgi:hypothetical protein